MEEVHPAIRVKVRSKQLLVNISAVPNFVQRMQRLRVGVLELHIRISQAQQTKTNGGL